MRSRSSHSGSAPRWDSDGPFPPSWPVERVVSALWPRRRLQATAAY